MTQLPSASLCCNSAALSVWLVHGARAAVAATMWVAFMVQVFGVQGVTPHDPGSSTVHVCVNSMLIGAANASRTALSEATPRSSRLARGSTCSLSSSMDGKDDQRVCVGARVQRSSHLNALNVSRNATITSSTSSKTAPKLTKCDAAGGGVGLARKEVALFVACPVGGAPGGGKPGGGAPGGGEPGGGAPGGRLLQSGCSGGHMILATCSKSNWSIDCTVGST